MTAEKRLILLSADDFAMTEGITRGIEELAHAGLLSATSALVTTPHWHEHAHRLANLRDSVAIGLHFNLTLGSPLGPMPRLAPDGSLPTVGKLTRLALTRRISRSEIEQEANRQLVQFESLVGAPPDFIDGHQHVHALPVVRSGLLAAVRQRAGGRRLLVRHPGDRLRAIRARGGAWKKALTISWLARGFRSEVEAAGLMVNDSFAGITEFLPEAAEADLNASLLEPGRLHIAMCHPGHPDAELAAIDPVTERRKTEMEAIRKCPGLATRIWHPRRPADGPPINWQRELDAL